VNRVRVLIADDHPVYRDGLVRAVAGWPELEVSGETEDGRATLEAIRTESPDVALVDLRLPGLDGIAVASAVTRDRLPTRVLILSAYQDDELVHRALEVGAAGYLSKDAKRDEIAQAVLRASRGQTVIPPTAASGLARQIRARAGTGRVEELTEREWQVLRLLCDGRSAPAIADELGLATTTVKTHLAHLYDKLGVSDRAAAVAEAMRRGLVE
jgi:two-component system nitrate/nitrite response regulator NarL